MKVNEFIQDLKDMVKTKDTNVVKEKYLKPACNVIEVTGKTTWNFIVENTPKAIAATKGAIKKGQDAIEQIKTKKTSSTVSTPKTESKTEIKIETTETTETTAEDKNQGPSPKT